MKIMKLLRRVKLNNKGMTLVEIIVAVAVFTLVAVPAMRIFGSSSSTNFKSRARQRATLVGESIMESFKAYDMEAICNQVAGNVYNGVKMTSSSPTVTAVVGGTNVSPFRSDHKLRRDADAFVFSFPDVEADGCLLDAEVIATPVEKPEVIRMTSPNEYYDAIIKLDSSFNSRLAGEVIEHAKADLIAAKPTVSLSDITNTKPSNFKRKMTISVDDAGGVQKVTLKVHCSADVEVTYKVKNALGVSSSTTQSLSVDFDVNLPEETDPETELLVYDNTNTISGKDVNGRPCKLNQIYLYYCPAYKCFFGDGASEEIELEGMLSSLYDPDTATDEPEAEGKLPLRLIIAKQKYTGISDTNLNLQEIDYTAKVSSSISGSGEVVCVNNFDKNLSTVGSAIAPVPVSGDFLHEYHYGDAFDDEVELRYDIEIRVYDDRTGKEVAVFTGTANN